MNRIEFQLKLQTCPSCIKKIEDTLKHMNGVIDAKVLFNANKVKVGYNDAVVQKEEILNRIEKIGYKVLS